MQDSQIDNPGWPGVLLPTKTCLPSRSVVQCVWLQKDNFVNQFAELGLAAPILETLDRVGYQIPTPIQAQAIPPVIGGHDILGIAQTGTGKTAAFALPILHRLDAHRRTPPRNSCRVLVLSPTRELASQIGASFKAYAGQSHRSFATVFGGVKFGPQVRALSRGVDVLVATPGRLLDHISSGTIKLDQTEMLVLDEADQMLDLGFVKPIRQIVSHLPRERQTLLFSATMPAPISKLASDFLRYPKTVSVTPVSSTTARVAQRVIHLDVTCKRAALTELIVDQQMVRTLVFTRTKRGADRVAKYLERSGIRVASIHGGKRQSQREGALRAFKSSKLQVLVATDIAARGIDIADVSHVINFELPEVPEAYVHRIGRTARAGASGSAISLCDRAEIKYLRGIEELIRQTIQAERWSRADVSDTDGTSAFVHSNGEPEHDVIGTGRSSRPHGPRGKPSRGRSGKKTIRKRPQQTGARRAKPTCSRGKRRNQGSGKQIAVA